MLTDIVLARVNAARSLLDGEYALSWTVELLARRVYCNRTDLQRGFQEHVGQTVHAYLTVRRIDVAQSLLLSTPWRISEVGLSVGYRSKVSFYANFSKVVGITPDEFRKAQRGVARAGPSSAASEATPR